MEKMLTILGCVIIIAVVALLVFITIGIWKPLIGDPATLARVTQVVDNQGRALQQLAVEYQSMKQDMQMMKKLTTLEEMK